MERRAVESRPRRKEKMQVDGERVGGRELRGLGLDWLTFLFYSLILPGAEITCQSLRH